jgi:hypothetical protein
MAKPQAVIWCGIVSVDIYRCIVLSKTTDLKVITVVVLMIWKLVYSILV